jgi:hypothetical protein
VPSRTRNRVKVNDDVTVKDTARLPAITRQRSPSFHERALQIQIILSIVLLMLTIVVGVLIIGFVLIALK